LPVGAGGGGGGAPRGPAPPIARPPEIFDDQTCSFLVTGFTIGLVAAPERWCNTPYQLLQLCDSSNGSNLAALYDQICQSRSVGEVPTPAAPSPPGISGTGELYCRVGCFLHGGRPARNEFQVGHQGGFELGGSVSAGTDPIEVGGTVSFSGGLSCSCSY
jgi:hypothetical protein